MIFIILFVIACEGNKKWKGVGRFEINRQESYNYSEMLSGELDSAKKKELEEFKQKSLSNINKDNSKSFSDQLQEIALNSLKTIKDIYNKILTSPEKNSKFERKILE